MIRVWRSRQSFQRCWMQFAKTILHRNVKNHCELAFLWMWWKQLHEIFEMLIEILICIIISLIISLINNLLIKSGSTRKEMKSKWPKITCLDHQFICIHGQKHIFINTLTWSSILLLLIHVLYWSDTLMYSLWRQAEYNTRLRLWNIKYRFLQYDSSSEFCDCRKRNRALFLTHIFLVIR